MFEDATSNSLELEDLTLAAVVLAIPFGGFLFQEFVGGTRVLTVAVLASGLVCLKLAAGGQLLGSNLRGWLGSGFWLANWGWLSVGRGVAPLKFSLVFELVWLGLLLPLLFASVLHRVAWRRDDRALAASGLLILMLVTAGQYPWFVALGLLALTLVVGCLAYLALPWRTL
jgi:hypothetical protein